MANTVLGNLVGLKASQTAQLSRLYRRRVPTYQVFTYELAEAMTAAAWEIDRPLVVLINRSGHVTHVVVGDPHGGVSLPELRKRESADRLSGWRGVMVHPGGGALDKRDLMGLVMNRLDMLVAIDSEGAKPHSADVWISHLLPEADAEGVTWTMLEPIGMKEAQAFDFEAWLYELERSMAVVAVGREVDTSTERALLVGVQLPGTNDWQAAESISELEQLAQTAGAVVLDKSIQKRKAPEAATLLGKGKVEEIALRSRELNANTVIVDAELSPSQQRKLEDAFGLKVLDRTALILDIFAQRAQTKEGKLQVELAQLKYSLPRLSGSSSSTGLSRQGGGIGARGPGETKLETDRRRVNTRIAYLENEVEQIKKHRGMQRKSRQKRGAVQVAIMGYTNAGKSTLLNTLTKSTVLAENKLFATLDPVTRKLYLPGGNQVLLTDTVGFIQRLPTTLVAAFRATLEEVTEADVLLHVMDASHPNVEEHYKAVVEILEALEAMGKPMITALNKVDAVTDPETLTRLRAMVEGPVEISALTGEGLRDLLATIESEAQLTEVERVEPAGPAERP
ncbi:MAG: GTPase [Cyanobacteria bacterium RYN_339]|nr:GTPase [Cyanobacteria bacterium RYN_339]